MPLRLEIKKKLVSRSDRVKCVDLHPDEPWVLSALYNGHMFIWNYETQVLAKSFEVTDQPLRCCTFVARKQWAISGADDMFVRVYNYNTLEKVRQFEAHIDYIRSIEAHPTLPYLLTSSDDMQIKLWDWEKNWQNTQIFEGHAHYVMQVRFNPKDSNTFASASLDRTIKVWSLGSPLPNYSLEGHERGVNCIDYYAGGDKPYILSGADDHTVKIWDYQTKTCVQTLTGHTNNVSAVSFHPKLPIILSGSEDGTVRVWHATTYRLESTLNYGLERAWTVAVSPSSNKVAIGYDEGTIVLKLGHEMPVTCMDQMGNIIQAINNDIVGSAIRNLPESITDGDRIDAPSKDLGACEIYPQKISFNNNGRFVVVCGDGEYIIYTSKALRNKSFGSALDFGWSATETGDYAVREAQSKIRIFQNFKEVRSFKTPFSAEGLFGGHMVSIVGTDFIVFYDWNDERIIRRIDVAPKNVYWSDSGTHVVLSCEESYFVLSCDRELIANSLAGRGNVKVDPEDGVEGSFEYLDEVSEKIRSGQWIGDCFVYTNAAGRLNYYVGGEVFTLCHLDRPMYMLGFLAKENRVFLMDKARAITSYVLLESVLQYQTAIVRRDFDVANEVLGQVPQSEYNKIARFLESQGFKEEALQVCTDPEQKFDLALQLQKFDAALDLMREIVKSQPADAGIAATSDIQLKWKQLGDLALAKGNLELARECSLNAGDFSGLLLMYTASGDEAGMLSLAEKAYAAGRINITLLAYFLLGNVENCLKLLTESGRVSEAAFMARTYLPSKVSEIVKLWKQDLSKSNPRGAEALADPAETPDLFPNLKYALQAESMGKHLERIPASNYADAIKELELNLIEEMKRYEAEGIPIPVRKSVGNNVQPKRANLVPSDSPPKASKVDSPKVTKPAVAPAPAPIAQEIEEEEEKEVVVAQIPVDSPKKIGIKTVVETVQVSENVDIGEEVEEDMMFESAPETPNIALQSQEEESEVPPPAVTTGVEEFQAQEEEENLWADSVAPADQEPNLDDDLGFDDDLAIPATSSSADEKQAKVNVDDEGLEFDEDWS